MRDACSNRHNDIDTPHAGPFAKSCVHVPVLQNSDVTKYIEWDGSVVNQRTVGVNIGFTHTIII